MANQQIKKTYLDHQKNIESLEAALEIITTTMATCRFYASIYAKSIEETMIAADNIDIEDARARKSALDQDRLKLALPKLYAAVLVFSIKAKQYFMPSNIRGEPNWF